jgi:hypothetical protein
MTIQYDFTTQTWVYATSQLKYKVIEPECYDDDDFCNCGWCKGFRNVLFFTYRPLTIEPNPHLINPIGLEEVEEIKKTE